LRTAEEIQRAIDASEAVFGLDLEPWDAFTAYMYSAYGRRSVTGRRKSCRIPKLTGSTLASPA